LFGLRLPCLEDAIAQAEAGMFGPASDFHNNRVLILDLILSQNWLQTRYAGRDYLGAEKAAIGTAPDAMRTVQDRAASADKLAIVVEQRKARNLIGHDDPPSRLEDVHRAVDIFPDGEQVSGAIEDLNPVALAVSDQHAVFRIDPDGMRRGELPGPATGLAPAVKMTAIGGESMYAGIAIAIRHVGFSVCGESDIGRMIEWPSQSRPAPDTEPREELTLGAEDEKLVGVSVHNPDAILGINRDTVGIEY
jgi:hypothetical protein